MKYASFRTPSGEATWGIVDGNQLVDLGPSGASIAPTIKDLIEDGRFDSPLEPAGAPRYPIDAVEFLPVITNPGKIICIGVNYRSHQDEIGKVPPSAPTVFIRFADSQMGHGQPALMPPTTSQFDYEGEMALVIGQAAHLIEGEDAWSVIAGYAPYNDFSVRDWQRAASQWIPGKNFRGTGAFGPYLTPAVEAGDVSELTLTTRVNGEVRQKARLSDLIFDIPSLIAYVTGFTALAPGDVIVTGTPGGVGMFMEPQGLLSEGDIVEVEISRLGVLTNTVVQG